MIIFGFAANQAGVCRDGPDVSPADTRFDLVR